MSETTTTTTDLQPLDLSAYVTESTDSVEVKAVKRKVEQVARKYAKRHNWCSVVDVALEEMGISTSPDVRVTVTTTSPDMTLSVTVNADKLHGKTVEQQKAVVGKAFGDIVLRTDAHGRVGVMPFPVDAITSWSVPTTATNGQVRMRLHHGRRAHLGRQRGEYWTSLCGEQWRPYELVNANESVATCARCATRSQ